MSTGFQTGDNEVADYVRQLLPRKHARTQGAHLKSHAEGREHTDRALEQLIEAGVVEQVGERDGKETYGLTVVAQALHDLHPEWPVARIMRVLQGEPEPAEGQWWVS